MKLDCDVIRDLLPLYAEKLASPASSVLVEQHLAACPACRAELEQMEKPVEKTGQYGQNLSGDRK